MQFTDRTVTELVYHMALKTMFYLINIIPHVHKSILFQYDVS